MTTREDWDKLAPILFHYDLYPQQIERKGRVFKIYSQQGTYALKESVMLWEEAQTFSHHIRRLARLQYQSVIPIIPTKYGELTLSTEQHTYYVMPWIENEPYEDRESREQKIMNQMGIIHHLTSKSQTYEQDAMEESYQTLVKRWELRRLELERFIDLAEQKVYMSPFELTFMTHAHQLLLMMDEAKRCAGKWFDGVKEKEKYRTVLCHGKLSRKHVHFTAYGEPLLFNFERASLDTPARDLALFCRHSFAYALWNDNELKHWLATYEAHLPLFEEEKQLLLGYLHFPEPVLFSIDTYMNNRASLSELNHVRRLEKRLFTMRKVHQLKTILFPPEVKQT
ncbi:spore coat protein YsxE [Alkalihalobacterium bogoriense]|uniref:spore coat protein YsxE n=1 Tax=Alkalihalobacterium bogoriense TaxID=246272 RepID=UPI0006885A25|nr:spore coat protein YsxE [Alkalihalobacterium bogoriense]